MAVLARLSFWIPPEQIDTFEAAYAKKIVPILRKHELEESSERSRISVEGIFSRLFEMEAPSEVAIKEHALESDPAWREVLRSLGTTFGKDETGGLIRTRFGLYRTPAGLGKRVEAGPGTRRGVWQTLDVSDGLPSPSIMGMVQDREGHLWFGTQGGGVGRYDGETFVTFTTDDGLADNTVWPILEDREGHLWFGTPGGVSRYDGEEFVTFTEDDGLAHSGAPAILEDREGNLWFGTQGGGVSRYDGSSFITFTEDDGLAHNVVWSVLEDQKGHLWFGTGSWPHAKGGVSRYDGSAFVTFTEDDGLVHNVVWSILEDREGNLWFGTRGGVSRYDGEEFVNFTTDDGLADNDVMFILEDRKGNLWFGTGSWASAGGGVSRYDGERFVNFTTDDGLAGNWAMSILEDREGYLWFGTQGGGVSRYDAEQFVTLTTDDGLLSNGVMSILEDRKGDLWFGTWGGVSRYDGEKIISLQEPSGNIVSSIVEDRKGDLWFGTGGGGVSRYDPSAGSGEPGEKVTSFTTEHGLAHNPVTCVFQDREGGVWFGTWGGGVSRYDGLVFQNLRKRDGLVNNTVQHILQDRNGDIWIATEGGITRYRPGHTPPRIRITDVIADRRYGSVSEIRMSSSQKLLAFEFRGRSFTTHPQNMAYLVRLEGYESGWTPVYTNRVEYRDLPLGEYTFGVKAVDRDLNYSEPAEVRVVVEPDPRLEAFAEALSGMSEEFVGDSDALRRVEEQLVEVAPTDLTVLILGETGTGKGLAARTVHGLSTRKSGPFVTVTCGGLPEGLVESELFGHEKGAFTGAVSRKLGKVELAEGSTLFLDEIGDLSPEAQAKLLQFLEDRTFERVGGTETLRADVRVVAATNRDLRGMVEAGTFREDLYFRLQGYIVELPPLRERREDIPQLASYFMEQNAAHLDKRVTHLAPDALVALRAHDWPGNVRELQHVVGRAVIECSGPGIHAEDILLETGKPVEPASEEIVPLEEYERRYIRRVLEQTGWVVKGPRGAATLLGLHEGTLRSRMRKLGIKRPEV